MKKCLGEFKTVPLIKIPPDILKYHPDDKIDIDFLFVNGNPYLHMKTKIYKLRATQAQTGRGKKKR